MNQVQETDPIKYYQFPIRIDSRLTKELDRISNLTNIPKTTISRIALVKFLKELQDSGVAGAVERICSV